MLGYKDEIGPPTEKEVFLSKWAHALLIKSNIIMNKNKYAYFLPVLKVLYLVHLWKLSKKSFANIWFDQITFSLSPNIRLKKVNNLSKMI